MAGSATVTPDWSPVALRIREEATDYWDDKVAADRFTGKGGHLVRGHGTITGPGEVTVSASSLLGFGGPGVPGAPGHRDQQRHRARDPAHRGPGRHPLLDEPGDRPGRAGAGIDDRARAAGPSAPSWPRSSPASAPPSPWSRRCPGWCRSRSPRPVTLIERIFAAEGIKVCTDAPAERVSHNGTPVQRAPGHEHPDRPSGCSSPPAGGSDLAALGRGRGGLGRHGAVYPHRRVDARGGRRVGDRRRDRPRRVHAHVHVPGRHRGPRHPRPGRGARRLPGRAPGHVHRPGDRQRRA